MNIDKALDNYYSKFNRHYPTEEQSHLTEKEMIQDINNCIKENKIKKIDYGKGRIY